jgi:hypothetical protein
LPHATWPFEFWKLFPGEINNTADLKTIPALDGGRSSIRPPESKPNDGLDIRISRPERRARPSDAGVWNHGGPLVVAKCRLAVFSVRRFCVENLSNGAAPHASNNEAPVTGGKIACIQRSQGAAIGFDPGFC